MKEVVTIDGKQFELDSEYPLTEEQRYQTTLDIRKQIGCSTCNKTRSLGDGMKILADPSCTDIMVYAPANVTITDITIGTVDCSIGPTCPDSITCTELGCTHITVGATVTFANSGDIEGIITPTLDVGPIGNIMTYGSTPATIHVPGLSTTTATFSGVELTRGSNHVCANFT
jgi:hypothetical protein